MLKDTLPLIIAANTKDEHHLIVGTGYSDSTSTFTSSRIRKILNTGAFPIVVNPSNLADAKNLAREFQNESKFQLINQTFQLSDLTTRGRQITGKIVDRVYVNLPLEQLTLAKEIYNQCIKLRIPINTYQQPEHSTFSMIPTYTDPNNSGLQISVTTNGHGYILANRIKREIVSKLPSNITKVVSNMGILRDQIIAENNSTLLNEKYYATGLAARNLGFGLDEDCWESHKFNRLIREFDMTKRDQQTKRTRWLSQVMEYYPLSVLADITLADLEHNEELAPSKHVIDEVKSTEHTAKKRNLTFDDSESFKIAGMVSKRLVYPERKKSNGSISLVGSGPGSVGMLTIGALNEIKTADYILADKLVPQAILDLIPEDTDTFIARKFPGNAERAQEELLEKGLDALKQGKKVVRLKQGDPYIFGRGGEEFLFFSKHGYPPVVLPGLSSSLSSTVISKIPATHRGIADQVLICTGTGRKGSLPDVPEYVSTRTTIFLMALHRADLLTKALLTENWDPEVPVAVVERASCPDQRVTRTLLKYLPSVIEEIGSRPPGLLIIGKAVSKLAEESDVIFNDLHKFHVEEGFHEDKIDLNTILT